jgi:hypothetical protein
MWSWREHFPMCECTFAGDFNVNLDSTHSRAPFS